MRRIQKNKGLTLVELLIAMAIIVIVFAAVVPQFRAIRKSWAGAEAGAAIVQNGRVLAEHVTRNLSAAGRVISVSGGNTANGYITFQDNSGATKQYKVVNGYVVYGNLGSEEQLAGPVSKFQINCFSLDDFDTPTTDANSVRLVQVETVFTNSGPGDDRIFKSEVFIQANQSSTAVQDVIDIYVHSANADTAFDYSSAAGEGCDAVIDIDNKIGRRDKTHGLLMFKNIVGDGNDQVPAETDITEATLKLWYVNHNNNSNVYFYPMTVDWNETSTWNSIGGGVWPGRNCNSSAVVTASLGSSVPMAVEIDVTDIVQSWIDGDYENYGFGIINSSNKNLQFAAVENTTGTGAHTPILEVRQSSLGNDAGIVAQGYIYFNGNKVVCDSYNSSKGRYGNKNRSEKATLAVNTTGYNKIYIYYATVYGDAFVGPGGDPAIGINEYYGGRITGQKGALDGVIDMTMPKKPVGTPFDGPSKGVLQLRGNTSKTISTDEYYSDIHLLDRSKLVIQGDVTLLVSNMLRLYTDRNKIEIKPDSSLTLYIGGYLYSAGKLNADGERKPANLAIHMYNSNRTFYLYNKAESYCLVNNPGGYVYVLGSRGFYGRARALYFYSRDSVHIDFDSSISGSVGSGESEEWTFGGDVITGEILP